MAEVFDPPRPLSREVLLSGEEGLNPAEDLGVAQLKRGGPVGVTAPTHVANFMCTFLEGGDPVAHKCDHSVLIAQPHVLQLLEPLVDMVR